MQDDLLSSLFTAVKNLEAKVSDLQADIRIIHTATDHYKQLVAGLISKLDKYEQDRDLKCGVRLDNLEKTQIENKHLIAQLKEQSSTQVGGCYDQYRRIEALEKQNIEMEARLTSLSSSIESQLLDIKNIVTKSSELHQINEKEIKRINKRLDDLGWVVEIGTQFKKGIIGILVAVAITAIGFYTLSYKTLFELKDNTLTKKEILEMMKDKKP